MRRRPAPEPVSARALARLRPGRGTGWVPSRDGLGLADPPRGPVPGRAGEAGPDRPEGRHRRIEAARRWVRAPTAVVGARWQPGRAAVLGVAVVTVLAVLVLGLRVAWARGSGGDVVAPRDTGAATVGVSAGGEPVGLPSGAAAEAGGGPAPSPSGSAGASAEVVVHVVGEVVRPGVRRLPVGARVQDAVDAAGGATKKADLGGVNLARVLVDGEQIRVPRPGEVVPAGPSSPGVGGSGTGAGGGPVSLSTADVSTLDTLPGIGPVLAQRIVDWRTEHGRFASVDELAEVSGIGEKVLADLRPLVTP